LTDTVKSVPDHEVEPAPGWGRRVDGVLDQLRDVRAGPWFREIAGSVPFYGRFHDVLGEIVRNGSSGFRSWARSQSK
jgi:hypothetical protein